MEMPLLLTMATSVMMTSCKRMGHLLQYNNTQFALDTSVLSLLLFLSLTVLTDANAVPTVQKEFACNKERHALHINIYHYMFSAFKYCVC
jgi:hypothetical protein